VIGNAFAAVDIATELSATVSTSTFTLTALPDVAAELLKAEKDATLPVPLGSAETLVSEFELMF
jgi:hypothetical protein